jgi:hypothetical protein
MAIYLCFVLPALQLANTTDSIIFEASEFAAQAHVGHVPKGNKKDVLPLVCADKLDNISSTREGCISRRR